MIVAQVYATFNDKYLQPSTNFVETHGQLLKKLLRRKKISATQAAEMLSLSRSTLHKLFNKERIDDFVLEEIEKTFEVSPSYFPLPQVFKALPGDTPPATKPEPSCWQLLAEARQQVIDLQRQLIEMSKPSINAPKVKQTA